MWGCTGRHCPAGKRALGSQAVPGCGHSIRCSARSSLGHLSPAAFPTQSIIGQRFPPALAGNKESHGLLCGTQGGPTVFLRNSDSS